MIFNIGSRRDKDRLPPLFSSTGARGTDYLYAEQTQQDGSVQWELAILTSCTFHFSRIGSADVFLVSGGGAGSSADGCGGTGGRRLTKRGVTIETNTEHTVIIGGAGAATSAFGLSTTDSDAVSGANGGIGAWVGDDQVKHNATYGGDGAYAFGESESLITPLSGRQYGAGGGGGAFRNEIYIDAWEGWGGTTGGGKGGAVKSKDGVNGEANTGAGGGGPCRDAVSGTGTPGYGGSGIVIIRNARGEST